MWRCENNEVSPCVVCRKGVRSNIVQCRGCDRWVHTHNSSVKDSLCTNGDKFACKICEKQVMERIITNCGKQI